MDIKNLVKTNAVIVRVTQLAKGNIFKYVEESNYDLPSFKFGVVLDILNNGDKAYIQILSIKKGYASIDIEYKLLTEQSKISIFPAVPEDLQGEYNDIVLKLQKEIDDAKDKIQKNQHMIDFLNVSSTSHLKNLTPTVFEINS